MHSSPQGLCVWALAPPLSFRSTHPTIRSIALPKSLIGTASSTDPKANQWSFSQTLSMMLLSIKLLSQKAENNPRQLPLAPVVQPVNRQSCSFLNIFQLFLFSSTSVAITPAREPVWFTWNAAMVSHPFLPISNSFLTVGQMDFWSQSWSTYYWYPSNLPSRTDEVEYTILCISTSSTIHSCVCAVVSSHGSGCCCFFFN